MSEQKRDQGLGWVPEFVFDLGARLAAMERRESEQREQARRRERDEKGGKR